MHNLKLNQLEILITVVDTGSFSAAAIELDCTQSRISHAIAELEQVLGQRVLTRSRSGCVPTDVGVRVVQKARQMQKLADSLIETVQGRDQISARVRIACFRSVGTYVLPAILEALARDFPGIRIDVDDSSDGFSAAIIKSVRDGQADIGIARKAEVEDLLRQEYIHDTYCAVVPDSLTVDEPARWDQLASLPYIQPHNVDGASTLEACCAAGFAGVAARRMTNDIAILAMVSRGTGITIMPRLAAYPVPRGAKIVQIPVQLRRELAIYMRMEVARSKAAKIVSRYLRDKSLIHRTETYRAGAVGMNF